MDSIDVFDCKDYKDFLKKWLRQAPRGSLTKLAASAGSQASFLSQVMSSKLHLSPEQAWRIAKYIGLAPLEQEYFLLLIEFSKGQNSSYKEHIQSELKKVASRRLSLKDRFPVSETLGEKQKSLYFSSYLYSAVHLLCMIEELNQKDRMAQYLKISPDTLSKILRDLIGLGLIEEKSGRLRVTTKRIHLPSDSNLIIRHHTNWRLRALSAFERNSPESLHYSSVVTLSKRDADKLKSMIVDFIGKFGDFIKDSKSERCFVFNSDFFELGENF